MRSSSTQARSLPGFTPPRDERAEETEEEREVVNEAREEEAGASAQDPRATAESLSASLIVSSAMNVVVGL